MRPRHLVLALLAALALSSASARHAEAQRCSKGKPCGNTCIARDKICRVGQGTAVWAPGAEPGTPAPETRADAPSAEPGARAAPGSRASCRVARVVDGDTFYCAGGRRVRLLLIDAPERNQQFGALAARALGRLAPVSSEVTLEFDVNTEDRYGRWLAYVYARDGRMVNEEMALAGFALVSVHPPNVRHVERIRAAAAQAQRARRGLWSTSAFECAPADYRRGRC